MANPGGPGVEVDGGIAAAGAGGRIPLDALEMFAANMPDDLGKHIVPKPA